MPTRFNMTPQQGNVTLILYPIGAVSSTQVGIPTGISGNTLTLPITPEDMQISRPSRQAITQTLTSVYQDHLGSGVTTVVLRGHTGWRNLTPDGDGYAIIRKLRDLLGNFDKAVAQGNPDSVWLLLLLNLPSGWEQFRVSKNTVSFSRSRAQPLLYRYEMQFTVLRDFNSATSQVDPSPNFVIQQGIFPDVQFDVTPTGSSGGSSGTGSPGVTGPGGGDTTGRGALNPEAARAAVVDWKLLRKNVSDQEYAQIINNQTFNISGHKRRTGEEEPRVLYAGGVPPSGETLQQFANDQYDPSVYPSNMWQYVVNANPTLFSPDVLKRDPSSVFVPAGTVLDVMQITPIDALYMRSNLAGFVVDVHKVSATASYDWNEDDNVASTADGVDVSLISG